jgi:hypothetical protein
MIMDEQVLTLFGGWASVQTHLPIDPGLSVRLGVPIPSTITSQQDEDVLIYTKGWDGVTIFLLGNDVNPFSHFIDRWRRIALVRFFELWMHGSIKDMMRGLKGTARLNRSFGSLIGVHNAGIHNKYIGKVSIQKNGQWVLTGKSVLYPEIRRLPVVGVENARFFARMLRDKRNIEGEY